MADYRNLRTLRPVQLLRMNENDEAGIFQIFARAVYPRKIKERQMNQEQFKAFWIQLKAPLKAKWGKITDADLLEIEGNLGRFTAVLVKRYGTTENGEVNTWANRRYSHWSGNYTSAYADPAKVA